jgi:hypothetical protein
MKLDAPKQGSSSFLKKRTKKLLLAVGDTTPRSGAVTRSGVKFFWFFFSKKNCFLGAPPPR